MSLNIMCAICSEFYKPNDRVLSTASCGHLFHQQCLYKWLRRSNTCPQCRVLCHILRVHRVYLNFGERTEEYDLLDAAAADEPVWMPLHEPQTVNGPEDVPTDAIKAGTDPDGNDAYVARVYFHEDLLPSSYVPQKGAAYAPWRCRAHFLRNTVEILLDNNPKYTYKWVNFENGEVPLEAVVTGYSEAGESLFTGRAQYENITLPGKIHPSHGVLYMPYNGKEVSAKKYEVLVRLLKEPTANK